MILMRNEVDAAFCALYEQTWQMENPVRIPLK